MKTSARNNFKGTVLNVHHGAVNDEVEIVLDNSNTRITSIITSTSAKTLGLTPGRKVAAIFKAPWVILMTDTEGVKFSARNQFEGTVVSVRDGAVNCEVRVRLDGGEMLTAIVTEDSAKELALEPGKKVTALIKASHVIVGAFE